MNCMDEAGGLGMLSVGGGGGLSREKSEKRSFRRNSGSQEHPMAALLDSTGPKRQTSTRQRSKKALLFYCLSDFWSNCMHRALLLFAF